jgi:hypothetical protein
MHCTGDEKKCYGGIQKEVGHKEDKRKEKERVIDTYSFGPFC